MVLQVGVEKTLTGFASLPVTLLDYSVTIAFLDSASKHTIQHVTSISAE